MSGYIGSKSSVTQVDGYNRTEADAEFVAKAGDTMTGPLNVTGTVTADGLTVDGATAINSAAGTIFTFTDTTNSKTGYINWTNNAYDIFTHGPAKRLTIDGSGDISFYDDSNNAKFFWDASAESLGIGTSSPTSYASTTLQIAGSSATSDLKMTNTTTGVGDTAGYDLELNGNDINYVNRTSGGNQKFWTNSTQRMRIDSSGNVLVGVTSANQSGANRKFVSYDTELAGLFKSDTAGSETLSVHNTATSGTRRLILFKTSSGNGTSVGEINTNGSSTSYNTSSDYRLKTDAQPMAGASARVQALNPVNFEWIVDGTRVDGFLAHEAQAVVPESVTGTKDAMMDEEYEVTPAVLDDDGNETTPAVMGTRNVPDYQGIDQSKLVPLLTAALQEALNKIDTMETRLAALEGN